MLTSHNQRPTGCLRPWSGRQAGTSFLRILGSPQYFSRFHPTDSYLSLRSPVNSLLPFDSLPHRPASCLFHSNSYFLPSSSANVFQKSVDSILNSRSFVARYRFLLSRCFSRQIHDPPLTGASTLPLSLPCLTGR